MCDIYKASVDEISVMRGNAIRQEKETTGRIAYCILFCYQLCDLG